MRHADRHHVIRVHGARDNNLKNVIGRVDLASARALGNPIVDGVLGHPAAVLGA